MSDSLNILVVEDDDDIRDFARSVLESADFVVRSCGRAEEARALVRDMKPDLAIVDIGLPDGSGLELCKIIRDLDSTIPVIVVTARGELKTRLECFQLGAQDYLQKPFAVQELLARVKVHLNMKKSHDDLAKRAYNLELINRARQDLMDMIVHDLKTPLTSIKGTLELIQARGLIDQDDTSPCCPTRARRPISCCSCSTTCWTSASRSRQACARAWRP